MTTKSRTKTAAKKSLANEVMAVVLLAAAMLLLLSILTYDPRDPSWSLAGSAQEARNLIGVVGSHLSDFFLQLFGLTSLLIPILLTLIAARAFFSEEAAIPGRKALGATLLLIAASGFLALFPKLGIGLVERYSSNGGAVGYLIEISLVGLLNSIGAAIVLTVATLLTLMLTMEISLGPVVTWVKSAREARAEKNKGKPSMIDRLAQWWNERAERRAQAAEERRLSREREHELHREQAARLERERAEELRRKSEVAKKPRVAEPVILKTPAVADSSAASLPVAAGLEIEGETANTFEAAAQPRHAAEAASPAPAESGVGSAVATARRQAREYLRARTAQKEQPLSANPSAADVTMDPDVAEMTKTAWIDRTVPVEEPAGVAKQKQSSRKSVVETYSGGTYKMPALDLLEAPIGHHEQAEEDLRERATILAEKCKEFSVTGHIHRINPGPVVTTFEFKPDPGIKYSRVVGLADDLCLALKAESIRIDRIPGKSTVGIEAPNHHREKIFLRDIIESSKFQQSESKLTVALGKTINGEEYIADLSKMPHLLIAGATGAGKSVTLNSLICSVLYKATPEEVKFIMVDPKRVELGLYENIPHLLTPIVTDPKRASNALKWAVNEMESRYRELATLGVRNIEQYNRQVKEMTHPTLSADNPEAPKPLPYIVIAIDELADLMMVARGEVETSIARLAQMARAVGIHLVLATQRPSVDIITGVIKANIPSRIAFRVSSKVDSRTIIDSNGAEALLGQGDMLFLPPGTARLIRVHGSFVNENEVKRIADHTRQQAQPDFNEQVTLSEQENMDSNDFEAEQDELFDEALLIVTDMGRASTSVLQRRLSIGYGRAAKILDMMERRGFIGPAEGSKPRKVLQAAFEFRDRAVQIVEEDFD
ncbi:MAG TPA: DNA translocase FtsK [Blastocatellia bacterium]|jgi:S-DNA-T family DNA segregation ATPase FtsK/SpoIIIE